MGKYVLSYDVGTTGIKTCLFELGEKIRLKHSAMEGYKLYVMDNGGVEQDPQEWWEAMCITTKRVIEESGIHKSEVLGISFCAQMQGVVLVDRDGAPVRRAMSYMDNRAEEQFKDGIEHGIKVAGMNLVKLLKSLRITGAAPASVKDPLWKYKWVEKNEPEVFNKIYKWLDVKEFLICRTTGKCIMTEDSAFATMLYDSREGKKRFSREMCRIFKIREEHLPEVIKSSDCVGNLKENAAEELGLETSTKVFGGGGDASLIGVGSGAVRENQTHVYLGTSGWVSTVIKRRIVDLGHMIASIIGAQKDRFNYFAELETAGKCLEWVKDHLALDEIGVYLEQKTINQTHEELYTSLYDYMMHVIKDVPPGSGGVIFTPWLHGNRCPFEDHNARGMFFNISLDTGKTELIKSVIEGICYHLRWQMEASQEKISINESVRFVGGGALAPVTCQILADVLNKRVETVENPQNVGAVGAAIVAAVGLGIIDSVDNAEELINIQKVYVPKEINVEEYNKHYSVFKRLYKNNRKEFKKLNNSFIEKVKSKEVEEKISV